MYVMLSEGSSIVVGKSSFIADGIVLDIADVENKR